MATDLDANSDLATHSLELVHRELGTTLDDARREIEEYVDGQSSQAALQRAADLLHLASGALKIVEVHGAALLAEEMEHACRHLCDGIAPEAADKGTEALTRSMVQLPAYLDRLLSGGRDVALVLLPLINDLRAVRAKPLMSEGTLLLLRTGPLERPNRSGGDTDGQANPAFRQIAQQQRPTFQSALLGWIRGAQPEQNLDALILTTSTLEQAAQTKHVQNLWGILCGIFIALREHSLDESVALKRLVGQADRQLKRLADDGEQAFRSDPPNDLINNLLYYIARADSEDDRIRSLRNEFNLNQLVPGEEQLERAREGLAGPSVKLMRTVAEAIRQDLGAVKDALDIFVRTGMQDMRQLLPQLEMLQKIGDTLGVLGLETARTALREQMSELTALVETSADVDAEVLERVAAVLLNVEDDLDRELVRAVVSHDDAEGGRGEGEAQYSQVTQAVMSECIVNLAKVKEAVVRLVDTPDDTRPLEAMRPQLRGIAAGLLMLNKTTVVRLIERIGAVLLEGLNRSDGKADTQRVERLADAIVSVEYYMETVSAGRKDPWYMLENAARCLELLESTVVPQPAGALALEQPAQAPSAPEPAASEQPAAELSLAADDIPVPAMQTPPEPETGPAPDELTLEPAEFQESATSSTGVMAAIEADAAAGDPELIEIFIEEARGEISQIQQHLPIWLSDTDNFDAISATRRSFHTLKGSGRTVGAVLIGDFSWSIENMLNRVINRTLTVSDAVTGVVSDAVAALPALLEHLELGLPPRVDTQAIRDRADALASGEALDEAAQAAEPAPRIDPVLAEIFVKETRGHLATVDAWLQRAQTLAAPYAVDEALYRAVHTLLGSANMASYEPCVQVAEPLSAWLSHCFSGRHGLDDDAVVLLRDAADALTAIADGLAASRIVEPPRELLGRLARAVDAASRTPAVEYPAQDQADELADDLPEDLAQASFVEELAEPAPEFESAPMAEHELPTPVPEPSSTPAPASPGPEFDPEIAAIFTEEAAELLEQGEVVLQSLRAGGDAAAGFSELQRLLHTLKGGARLAGIPAMGDLSHALETVLERMAGGQIDADAGAMELIQRTFDALQDMRESVDLGRACTPVNGLIEQLEDCAGGQAVAPHTQPINVRPVPQEAPPPPVSTGDTSLRAAIIGETQNQPLDFDLTEVGLKGVDLPPQAVPPAAPTEPPAAPIRPPSEAAQPDDPLASSQTVELGAEELSLLRSAVENLDSDSAVKAAGVAAHHSESEPPVVTPPAALAEQTQPLGDGASQAVASDPQRSGERADVARVDAQLLDSLLNAAGEISIFQARLNQQVRSVDFHLGELGQTVTRLREQLRKLEAETEAEILHRHQDDAPDRDDFDPLELDRYSTIQQLSRALSETANDVASINELLLGLTNEADTLLTQQGRVTADIQDGLMQTRMVPFQRHVTRFARLVRQTAAETGKQAELEVRGAAAELDRHVLESMLPPLEHLLRNSVVHGIESPEARERSGKPALGRIELRINREGGEVSITVDDDGSGLNIAAITRTAIERGLLAEGQTITEKQAAEMILMPGFSTAGQLTQSAGRGVGMDVVDNELKKLGGSMTIESTSGRGTRFHIRLPYTLAITHALIVDVGEETFALPLTTVEGITRVRREHLLELLTQDDPRLEYGELSYRLQHLGSLVGSSVSALPQEDGAVALVLVRAGDNSTALLTDRLEGSREVVVKGMGPHIASIPGVTGATILGDGRVIMILDAGTLIRRRPQRPIAPEPVPVERDPETITALVVDDSITMRRVTERLLERRGVKVATARDGLDAITVMQDTAPDIILLDIEMPRMDGYQFAAHVRNDARFSNVPIIMITSRSGEKHRAKAIEVGVNDYLSKPYQEQHLVDAIESQLGRRV